MKLFKKKLILIISLFLLTITSLTFFFLNYKQSTFDPISNKNDFYNQLNLILKTGHLETSSWIIRDFLHQIEFNIADEGNSFKIVLSDQKNPLTQIASLQELIKTAKINNQTLKLINLSAAHPYATFKNN
jgi:hypothetical protein